MSESEWATATEPHPMLVFLWSVGVSPRKLQLFAAACCRRVWHRLPDPRSRRAVEVAERYADGEATVEEVTAAREEAVRAQVAVGVAGRWDAGECGVVALAQAPDWLPDRWPTASSVAGMAARAAGQHAELTGRNRKERRRNYLEGWSGEEAAQCGLLRDIVGPLPFRPVELDRTWRTEAVVGLAREMYESRDFGPVPVLADALEDAGCADGDILSHCRGSGPHVRGCWVVDAVLGKS
ncbi:MAG TPA: hypothetical protein VD866_27395 [Urbifossiella sp.]|nr:hypothetical protein [Urbifossiella sp.]